MVIIHTVQVLFIIYLYFNHFPITIMSIILCYIIKIKHAVEYQMTDLIRIDKLEYHYHVSIRAKKTL